jgi:hypothetical protein
MLKSSLRISSSVPQGNTTGGVPNILWIERFTRRSIEIEATFDRNHPTASGNETVSFWTSPIRPSQLAIFIGGACGCLPESGLLNHSGLGVWKLNWKKNLIP